MEYHKDIGKDNSEFYAFTGPTEAVFDCVDGEGRACLVNDDGIVDQYMVLNDSLNELFLKASEISSVTGTTAISDNRYCCTIKMKDGDKHVVLGTAFQNVARIDQWMIAETTRAGRDGEVVRDLIGFAPADPAHDYGAKLKSGEITPVMRRPYEVL